jgi:hypothetical protein
MACGVLPIIASRDGVPSTKRTCALPAEGNDDADDDE